MLCFNLCFGANKARTKGILIASKTNHLIFICLSFFQDSDYTIELRSKFDEFSAFVQGDDRAGTLDPGNIKMTFNHVSGLCCLKYRLLLTQDLNERG